MTSSGRSGGTNWMRPRLRAPDGMSATAPHGQGSADRGRDCHRQRRPGLGQVRNPCRHVRSVRQGGRVEGVTRSAPHVCTWPFSLARCQAGCIGRRALRFCEPCKDIRRPSLETRSTVASTTPSPSTWQTTQERTETSFSMTGCRSSPPDDRKKRSYALLEPLHVTVRRSVPRHVSH